jgi:hypothetical protein
LIWGLFYFTNNRNLTYRSFRLQRRPPFFDRSRILRLGFGRP